MEAAAGIAGVEIKAAADCYKGHLDRAQELISSAPAVTGDYQEILSRADIDAVVIATPDHWHLKMTQEALAAGKHVYIEKPMTHRWEDGEAFIAAVEKSGKVLQVGSQYMSMGCAAEGGRPHQERPARAGHPRRGQVPPQHRDRRLVLPDPAGRLAGDRRLQELPRRRPAARVRPPPLLPVAPLLGLLGRPARPTSSCTSSPPRTSSWACRSRRASSASATSTTGRTTARCPDQMTSMVKYPEGFVLRLSSTASNGHPGPLLTFYGSEGTLEYNGRLVQVLLRAAHRELRRTRRTPGRRPRRPSSRSS